MENLMQNEVQIEQIQSKTILDDSDKIIKLWEDKKKSSTEISMNEFLDFLRTAYQVTDTVEDLLSAEGLIEEVDWIKLKNNQLIRPKAVSCQTSQTIIGDSGDGLTVKLDEVLNEGLFDSVLPYMIPSQKKSHTRLSDKSGSSTSLKSNLTRTSSERRRSNDEVKPKKTDSEIEIHVCDEVKSLKRTFICSQKLLVEKMGYFADVTAGQKLEDMDISVHCDVQIFDWLMRWVKKEQVPEEDWPKLDPQCVISILVSAAFLQMEPLLEDCLLYCHENMNEILQNTNNLNCINDSLLNRLAAKYTNSELEAIKDKKDKILSRLYCKMILSLAEPVCESVRGHWSSLARIFRCMKCEQLIMPEISKYQPCQPSCMSINRYGEIISHHQRDDSWNINNYIIGLQTKLKSWRKVYWHLWGDCHFLFCSICNKPFPAHRMKWCCYHPDEPQFFTIDSQKAPLPIGRYPCCGERAYRFELLDNNNGCQFHEHSPKTSVARDAAVYLILQNFRKIIDTEPPELIFPERLTRLVARDSSIPDGKLNCKDVFWWEGLQIVPANHQMGLLDVVKESLEPAKPQIQIVPAESSESISSDSITSSHSEESPTRVVSPQPAKTKKKRKRVKKKIYGNLWQLNLSARSNQDLQRCNEENLITKMINRLCKKTSLLVVPKQKGYLRHITPSGGIYARLEAEWKEANGFSNNQKRMSYIHKPKIKTTRIA